MPSVLCDGEELADDDGASMRTSCTYTSVAYARCTCHIGLFLMVTPEISKPLPPTRRIRCGRVCAAHGGWLMSDAQRHHAAPLPSTVPPPAMDTLLAYQLCINGLHSRASVAPGGKPGSGPNHGKKSTST